MSSARSVPRLADRNVSVIFYGYRNARQSTSTLLWPTTIRDTTFDVKMCGSFILMA